MFDATITSATIMVLFGAANTFGRILTMNSVPTMVTQWMLSVTSSKALIMLMINIALLIIGMFLDTILPLYYLDRFLHRSRLQLVMIRFILELSW